LRGEKPDREVTKPIRKQAETPENIQPYRKEGRRNRKTITAPTSYTKRDLFPLGTGLWEPRPKTTHKALRKTIESILEGKEEGTAQTTLHLRGPLTGEANKGDKPPKEGSGVSQRLKKKKKWQ